MSKRYTMTDEEREEWMQHVSEDPNLVKKYCGLKFYEDGFGHRYIDTFQQMWLRHSNLYIKFQTMKNRQK